MATFGRVLLWTVVLLAPGGFLLVPVLAATSLHARGAAAHPPSLREQWRAAAVDARRFFVRLQRYWTKS